MAFTADTGDFVATRGQDNFLVDPRALIVDWKKNLSRGGEEPTVDEGLIALAKDMMPIAGPGESEQGTSGQLNPIVVRKLSDRRLEVIGGFRRMRAALWLIESGTCPDFKIKYNVSKWSDAEAALINLSENIQREDPKPIQLAHAVRLLTGDHYRLTLKDVAGRLKRSVNYLQQLLKLVELPAVIQESVASGETTVSAGIELTKLDGAAREVFDEIRATGGKRVKAADVKAANIKRQETTGVGGPIRRSYKEVLEKFTDFLQGKTGPLEDAGGRDLASALLNYIHALKDGTKTVKQSQKVEKMAHNEWENFFPLPIMDEAEASAAVAAADAALAAEEAEAEAEPEKKPKKTRVA
jgi:ParB/RepB/Spo0J family partition protein